MTETAVEQPFDRDTAREDLQRFAEVISRVARDIDALRPHEAVAFESEDTEALGRLFARRHALQAEEEDFQRRLEALRRQSEDAARIEVGEWEARRDEIHHAAAAERGRREEAVRATIRAFISAVDELRSHPEQVASEYRALNHQRQEMADRWQGLPAPLPTGNADGEFARPLSVADVEGVCRELFDWAHSFARQQQPRTAVVITAGGSRVLV